MNNYQLKEFNEKGSLEVFPFNYDFHKAVNYEVIQYKYFVYVKTWKPWPPSLSQEMLLKLQNQNNLKAISMNNSTHTY